MLYKMFRWLPLEISLVTFSCAPHPASPAEAFLQLGTGYGQTIVSGEVQYKGTKNTYHLGTDIELDDWRFSAQAASATDNQFHTTRLLAEYGNPYIRIGTGFIGTQSSIATQPGTIAGFYATEPRERTSASATTIPVTLRLTPIQTQNVLIELNGYYGLMSKGSLTVPIKTFIPGKHAYLHTESQRTGGTYGGGARIRYRVMEDVWLQLMYQKQYGRLDANTAQVSRDILGWLDQVVVPNLNFNNELLLVSLVLN